MTTARAILLAFNAFMGLLAWHGFGVEQGTGTFAHRLNRICAIANFVVFFYKGWQWSR